MAETEDATTNLGLNAPKASGPIPTIRRQRKTKVTDPHFWTGTVSTQHAEFIPLAYCFCTGLVDASVFGNYAVFVAMQTGNTVILALSTANLPHGQPYAWLTTLVSIVSFLIGAALTAHLSYALVPLRRVTLFGNLMLQGIMIVVPAVTLTTLEGQIPTDNDGTHMDITLSQAEIVAVIPCLAFQAGAQIVTSKLLGVDEIPVNVVTSLYAGLVSDRDVFVWKKNGKTTWGWDTMDYKRSRRLVAVVLIFAGAVCAAWILRAGPGLVLSLWIAAGIKIVVAIGAALWMGQDRSSDQQDRIG